MRLLLSIIFPQGFQIFKNFGHPRSEREPKRYLNGTSKVNTHTDKHTNTHIWEISPRAGIDCYWIGEFLIWSEAYKYVDLFKDFCTFVYVSIFLAKRSSSILFTSFTCWTCLKWPLNLDINEIDVFWGTFEHSLL